MTNTKQRLIEHAVELIASKGITNFSMKKVTDSVGVSEALIYKYFDTKEEFLYQCFESVHKDIAMLFNNIELPTALEATDILLYIKELWFVYFDFLINNGARTIFYFEYRNSPYIETILARDEQARQEYFGSFVNIFSVLKEKVGVPMNFDENILWAFVLDVSGMYAIRIIKKELPNSFESKNQIWKLISKGIVGCIH